MCMAILRWAAPRLQFTFLGSYVCIGSRKISPREILTHQAPPHLPGKFLPEKFSPRKFPPGIFPPISLFVWLHLTLRP